MPFMYGPTRKKCVRLSDFDYSLAGAYFVTICTQDRCCLFGNVINEQLHQSPAGKMIQKAWLDLPTIHPRIQLDEFIVMPNHLHGIIVLESEGNYRAGTRPAPTGFSLLDLVRIFKSMTTVHYIRGMKQHNWPPFRNRLWQRGFFEHVVRDDDDLCRIREYIRNNPKNWDTDPENPCGS